MSEEEPKSEKIPSHLARGKGFTQINNEYLWPHWAGLFDCPPAGKLIFFLMAHMNRANYAWGDQKYLMKGTGLPRKTLYRALTFLEDRKFIVREGKGIILNEWMLWKGLEGVNPYLAKAFAEPVIVPKRQPVPKKRTA